MYRSLTLAGLSATLALTACSGSGTSPKSTPTQNLSSNVLQLGVGTANIYGDTGAGVTGLNVAVTYRQGKGGLSPGDSGVAVSGPTLTIPNTFTAPAYATGDSSSATVYGGPAPSEEGTSQISFTSQTGSALSSFGTSGGAFGLGIEPFNFNNEGGVPYTYVPYQVPLFDPNFAGDLVNEGGSSFIAYGYPPAFPAAGSSSPAGGYSEGLDVFADTTPVTGTYSLSVSVPVKPTFTVTKTATIASAALLPPFVQQLPSLDANNDGGATFPITFPAGVTEAYVQIYDLGPTTGVSCNGSTAAAPTSYTIEVAASGTATLPPTLGPGGTPSICTVTLNTATNGGATNGDQFAVELVGFDYPWYEASYPNSNGNPAPAIVGANGQSDVTISSAITYEQVAGAKILKSFRAKQSLKRHISGHFKR